MSSRNPIGLPSAANPLAADHSMRKPMCSDHGYQCIPLRPLSDEAAVEILDFLQVFTTDFEIRYGDQIRRYYDDRSRHNIVQTNSTVDKDDPPF
jgi:hypothetical protein